MFGMGMPEIILILAVALIVFGPKKLPELAKSLGRALSEFKKATNEFKYTMEESSGLKDVKDAFDDVNASVKDTIDIAPKSQPQKSLITAEASDAPEPDKERSEKRAGDTEKKENLSEADKEEGVRKDDA